MPLVLALVALFALPATACDLIPSPKVAFDPATFVFEGRVVGFVTDGERPSFEAWYASESLAPGEDSHAAGLLVAPFTVVNAPEPAEVYAVFPTQLGVACELALASLRSLRAAYAVGDTLAIVAQAPPVPASGPFFTALPLGTVPVISGPVPGFSGPFGGLILRAAEVGGHRRLASWGTEGWEYTTMADAEAHWYQAGAAPVAWSARVTYEYERDLAALTSVATPAERFALLTKVRRYWFTAENGSYRGDLDCGYGALVRRYAGGLGEADEVGGQLLHWGLRPFPSEGSCAAAERVRGEAHERIRLEGIERQRREAQGQDGR